MLKHMFMLHYTVDKYIHNYLFNGHSLSSLCWSICLDVLVMLYFCYKPFRTYRQDGS